MLVPILFPFKFRAKCLFGLVNTCNGFKKSTGLLQNAYKKEPQAKEVLGMLFAITQGLVGLQLVLEWRLSIFVCGTRERCTLDVNRHNAHKYK